jgi:hypothetical protein
MGPLAPNNNSSSSRSSSSGDSSSSSSSCCGRAKADNTGAGGGMHGWALVRRAAAAAGIAGALLACAPFAGAAQRGGGSGTGRVVAAATSEVEAAAVTLGVVTVGGLAMRAVVHARTDPDADRKKAEEQSIRLAKEEEERGRRMARKRMEQVDDGEGDALDDDELLSDLQSRLELLNAADSDADAEADGIRDDLDKFMRHNPIPERGTGSMLLDRPDEGDVVDATPSSPPQEDDNMDQDDAGTPDPENLELLKRMWNLNSPDDKDRTK